MAAAVDLKWKDILELAELRETNPVKFKNKVHWIKTALTDLSLDLLDVSLMVDDKLLAAQSKRNAELAKMKAKQAGVVIKSKGETEVAPKVK